jgi:hypothetical protein
MFIVPQLLTGVGGREDPTSHSLHGSPAMQPLPAQLKTSDKGFAQDVLFLCLFSSSGEERRAKEREAMHVITTCVAREEEREENIVKTEENIVGTEDKVVPPVVFREPCDIVVRTRSLPTSH